jgi:pimeloyl-ACP methyl ester carboxylesterase
VLLAGVFVGKIYLNQGNLIFPRTVNAVPVPNPNLSAYEELTVYTPDGETLHGILFPAQIPSPTLVLAFGGNAHDVIGMATFLKNEVFPQGSVAVAALSYRGYPNTFGKPSTGTPTESSLHADARTLYDVLTARLHPVATYAVGYSLGTAVSAKLATRRPLNGIALIAPPASIRRLAQEKYPWLPVRLLLKYPFATEDILGNVTAPVALIYTATDGLISPAHIRFLKAAQPAATVTQLQGGAHGTILDNPRLPQTLQNFIPVSPAGPLQSPLAP